MDVYKYIDKVINIGLWLFNVFSKLIIIFNPTLMKVLHNNSNLRCEKDRCFILGNGPSLNNIDLGLLKEEETFAVNYFYNQELKSFESKYYVAIDDKFYKTDAKKYIDDVYKKYPNMKFILKYAAYKECPDKWDLKRAFFTYAKTFQYGDYVNCNCTKNMTACVNVVLQCIQIALFMGYKKIYLLGCDFSQYAQLKPNHFYDSNLEIRGEINMGDDARWASLVHYHHYALYKYAKAKGVEIINLTENSLIDAYPKKNFTEIMEKKE